ncbi:60S ribosomal protein L7a [Lemmus lemmus]
MLRRKAAGKGAAHTKRPPVLLARVNTVTATLVENKKAQLVVMTRNGDPIKLVGFLPALRGKMEVPTTSSRRPD